MAIQIVAVQCIHIRPQIPGTPQEAGSCESRMNLKDCRLDLSCTSVCAEINVPFWPEMRPVRYWPQPFGMGRPRGGGGGRGRRRDLRPQRAQRPAVRAAAHRLLPPVRRAPWADDRCGCTSARLMQPRPPEDAIGPAWRIACRAPDMCSPSAVDCGRRPVMSVRRRLHLIFSCGVRPSTDFSWRPTLHCFHHLLASAVVMERTSARSPAPAQQSSESHQTASQVQMEHCSY